MVRITIPATIALSAMKNGKWILTARTIRPGQAKPGPADHRLHSENEPVGQPVYVRSFGSGNRVTTTGARAPSTLAHDKRRESVVPQGGFEDLA